ncbi:lytic transglycosylase domain-containing protein [Streptomyces sp. NPDC097610]|uniref:lytic transglycosylase domain-containing protein n=1 Tax=Streptomyces sp. NPDC097610 TaxID=3157227 RepID=UPI0033225986
MGASGEGDTQGSSSGYIAAGVGFGVVGCFVLPVLFLCVLLGTLITAVLGHLFLPLVILCKIGILHCNAGGGGGGGVDDDKVAAAFSSDGLDELNEKAVPPAYLARIKNAGTECKQIGAIVIASQIQQESKFNEKLVGPDGAEGISQLPPDKFKEFGKDDDNNGKTSALDAADSIMAQGRYMCSLAREIDTLLANNAIAGDPLDLTLAAYDAGLDAVKQAKGIPESSEAQGYVVGVRSSFAVYSASVNLTDQPYPSLSAPPTEGS